MENDFHFYFESFFEFFKENFILTKRKKKIRTKMEINFHFHFLFKIFQENFIYNVRNILKS